MTAAREQFPSTPDTPDWGGRLPLLDPADLDQQQRELYDYLQANVLPWAEQRGFTAQLDGGRLIGPFNAFLRSPQISRSYHDLITTEMAQTALSAQIREIVILTVGVQWQSDYEIYAHTAVARSVGVNDAVIAAVLDSVTTPDFPADQAAAHTFTRALLRSTGVDDATYAQAEALFGISGLVDMVHLIGLYLSTCALLNTFNIPAPTAQRDPVGPTALTAVPSAQEQAK